MEDTHINSKSQIITPRQKQIQTISKLPLNGTIALITFALCMWYQMSSFNEKMAGLLMASAFSITELTWTGLSIEDGDSIYFSPFSPKKRKPHTTPHQWVVNVIFMPIIIPILYYNVDSMALRIIAFPLVTWVIEIIEGYFLMHIFGYNPAWFYSGDYSLFHGNIKLTYYLPFFIIGLWMEVVLFIVSIFYDQMLLRI